MKTKTPETVDMNGRVHLVEGKGLKKLVVLEGSAVRAISRKRKRFCVTEYEETEEWYKEVETK